MLRVCERDKAARGELEVTPEYDRVTAEKNLKLYNTFLEKMQIPVYRNRPSSQTKVLISGRKPFMDLQLKEQCFALANLLSLFRGNGKADLSGIGGSKLAGTVLFSRRINDNIKIIYQSVTGFYSHTNERL